MTTHPVTISGKTYQTAELTCPECGAAMVLRVSRHGCFYGCSRYPQCDGTHDGIFRGLAGMEMRERENGTR